MYMEFLHSIRFRRGRHIWKAAPVVFLYEWYLFDRRFLAVSGYENDVSIGGGRCGFTNRQAKGYTEAQIMGQLQPIVIDTHPIGNPWLNYSVYLNNTVLPGIIQLMVFLVTVFSIGTEIKYSTSRKWLDMGGVLSQLVCWESYCRRRLFLRS